MTDAKHTPQVGRIHFAPEGMDVKSKEAPLNAEVVTIQSLLADRDKLRELLTKIRSDLDRWPRNEAWAERWKRGLDRVLTEAALSGEEEDGKS